MKLVEVTGTAPGPAACKAAVLLLTPNPLNWHAAEVLPPAARFWKPDCTLVRGMRYPLWIDLMNLRFETAVGPCARRVGHDGGDATPVME